MKKKLIAILACACVASLALFALAGCSSGGASSSAAASSGSAAAASSGSAAAASSGAAASSAAAASSSAAAASSSAAAKEAVKLIVGFDQDFPPFGFVGDDGKYAGFDLDLAKEVCARNGWEYAEEPIDWAAKDALIDSGTITCIWNGFTMEGREDKYSFSEPYYLNEQIIVVKKGSGIEALADLEGKIVVTQTNSAAEALFAEDGDQAELGATFAELQSIGEYNTAFMELESGAVDAIAVDKAIAAGQIAAKSDVFVAIDETLSTEHYGVGFKLGETAMAQKVTETLKAMYADGTVEKIAEKYSGEEDGIDMSKWILK